jgi:hypothetical protein
MKSTKERHGHPFSKKLHTGWNEYWKYETSS